MPTTQQIKEAVLHELPAFFEADPEIQSAVLSLSRRHFADRYQTEGRIERILDELRRDREENSRKWEEQNRKWAEVRAASDHKWEEQNRKWEETRAESERKWEEQSRKWEENQQVNRKLLEEIQEMNRKHQSSIGALGARWGLNTEASFRSALKDILEKCAAVEVVNVTEFDDEGMVFGRPDQVELDIIIKNGTLIIVEIKSSMSKGDMYILDRKARFYEQRHQRKPARVIVISPMVAPNAMPVAKKLGIEVHSYWRDAGIDGEDPS